MRLLQGGDRLEWDDLTAGDLYGMAKSWLGMTQHSLVDDDMFNPWSEHLGHDLSHHYWPEVTETGLAAHAPGSTPGDHRDSMYQAMLPALLRLREKNAQMAAAEVATESSA